MLCVCHIHNLYIVHINIVYAHIHTLKWSMTMCQSSFVKVNSIRIYILEAILLIVFIHKSLKLFIYLFFKVLEIDLRALGKVGKWSTTKLYPLTFVWLGNGELHLSDLLNCGTCLWTPAFDFPALSSNWHYKHQQHN